MVDIKTVEYVAQLARIAVTDREKEYLAGQLSAILDYIDQLKSVNVEGVEPLRGLNLEQNILRPDEVISSTTRKAILANAPGREGDYFKVPKIIE
ncbi:MAG: Asp-tRNA(Asn)/Glu-tRNA(Gln) amidotransferase subunit GatC [Candidatus Omnitrophota bacterium]